MSRKQSQALLLLLLLWSFAWSLRAVVLDQRASGADTLFYYSVELYFHLAQGAWDRAIDWVTRLQGHPPLPYLLTTLLGALMGFGLRSVRLVSLLLQLVMLVQVHALTRRATGSHRAAVMAALVAATAPTLAGYFRLDYQEPLLTVMVLAILQLALTDPLRRTRSAALLGLLVGLAALTKLAFALIMAAPAAVYLWQQLRSPRAARNALVALLCALAVSGWWYLTSLDAILVNMASSSSSVRPLENLEAYFGRPTGNLLLAVLALGGLLWSRGGRRFADRQAGALLSVALVGGMVPFMLVFTPWSRYLLPLLALEAVFAGVLLGGLADKLSAAGARAYLTAVALALAATFAYHNSGTPDPLESASGEFDPSGLLRPDLRRSRAIWSGVLHLERIGGHALVVADCDVSFYETRAVILARGLERPGVILRTEPQEAPRLLHELRTLHVLEVSSYYGRSTAEENVSAQPGRRWFDTVTTRVLASYSDDRGNRVTLHRVLGSK